MFGYGMNGLESLIAGRYLRLKETRSLLVYVAPLAALVLWIGIRVARYYLDSPRHGIVAFSSLRMPLDPLLRWGDILALAATVLLGFFTFLIRRYTVFSSFSTYGLFLGSAALVVVLSVMSGFEQDLKHKILGANAHVLVTSPDQPFTDYRQLSE